MRRTLWTLALGVLASCGFDKLPAIDDMPMPMPMPMPSEFGLDTRPANATCVARDRPLLDTGVVLERQFAGLTFNTPMFLLQAPGDPANWYVVERDGAVRTFPANATSDAQVRTVVSVTVNGAGEGGLLGMAFHPMWPARRELYLSYTRTPAPADPAPVCPGTTTHPLTSILGRFLSSDGGNTFGPADEILRVGQPFANHNGGTINFGPDGYLYFGLGDGGSGDDPCASGQNLSSLLGKMLRLDINTPAGMYKVPADNPFVTNPTASDEIWSYGFRNPFRWSFDQATGDMWVGDVGQSAWEEIDLVTKGGNYGWKICEGRHRRGSTTALCNTPGMIDPVVAHPRSDAQSITGGYVYRGTAMPSLVGTYIYGDFVSGNIWALTYDTDGKAVPTLITTIDRSSLVAFGQGHDGEIYTVQIGGTISKLVPAPTRPADTFPQLLSATGCVDPLDPKKPAAGLIPYDVNSPLWSDGADKERYLAIPDGKTIAIGADGDWDLPIGSVAVKTFAVGSRPIETRLFMRHDDGNWAGYTYEWDDEGKDATLLPAGKNRTIGAQTWAYPSRNQCMQCHSKATGNTIGLETAQLNRDHVYASTNRKANQLATLAHIGLFSAPLAQQPDAAPRLAQPGGSESLEARARGYLHANCAHCHQPMGGGQGTMDLRYAKSLQETQTCNADNTQGAIGDASKLLVPGDPQGSVLAVRLHATDSKRMPPVAVSVVDPQGTKLVDDWIMSLTACP
jgi:uncharacterized repeat protein (TIGR03806 family)